MQFISRLAIAAVCAIPAFAQWELGATGGYGFRRDLTVNNAGGTAQLKFQPGPVFGFYGGQTEHGYLGGEAHYLYESSDMKVQSGGREATMGSRAHVMHFDFLVHTSDSRARIRPFLAIGGGVKIFEGTGPDRAAQPLSNFVLLTRTHELKPVMSPAVGLKVRLSRHVLFRAEMRYFGSPAPEKVAAPAPGATIHGWVHDFVPVAGIAGTF